MKILVAIPCYNCSKQIKRVLIEIDSILNSKLKIEQIIVIDNQSQDDSVKSAIETIKSLKYSSLFKVYRNVENVGLGGTHKVAFILAEKLKFTHVLIFHGDHQASALDIPNLIKHSEENNEITILGSRFSDLSLLKGYSQTRKIGNILLNVLYSAFTRTQIKDLGSGLNLFRLDDFPNKILLNFDNGFTFSMDLLLSLISQKRIFKYVPIQWSTIDQISNAHSLKVGFTTVIKLLKWKLNIKQTNAANTKTELIA